MKEAQTCKLNATTKNKSKKQGKWIQSMDDLNKVMSAIGHDKSNKKLLPSTKNR